MANRTLRLDLRTIASIATPVRTVRIEQNGSASKKNGTGGIERCVFSSRFTSRGYMLPFSYGRVFRNHTFTSSITIHHVIITLRHAIGRELISSSARGGTQQVKEEDLIDPYCVEDNPQRVPFKSVTSAAFKIKYDIVNTPCVVTIYPTLLLTSSIFNTINH